MEPLIGTIFLFAGNYAPQGYALCNGQILQISSYPALFSILGAMYGGNGISNFALPNLQGRVAVGAGTGSGLSSRTVGEYAGVENVTLLTTQIPAHSHSIDSKLKVSNQEANKYLPGTGSSLAAAKDINTDPGKIYNDNMPNTELNTASISSTVGITGGTQPHFNMQPYLVLNYIIAIDGIYPTRN